ncbi:ARM repeat-containing protein [Macrolepiota fuliginosa MF-IS2]|uniref:ARM repeat-containing protein n=1 Tax=Macrolepiota fuliginosa MF-IS2 TaxID=1400762 RepID=A0A9P5XR46_9AGAR|nr:ARM repeat-containing protein [Macrolepiota fuliginosa MF-IS2]
MTSQVDEKILDELIKKSQTADLDSLSSTDISHVVQAFTFPHASIIRSKAYVLLSAISQNVRGVEGARTNDNATEKLVKLFGPPIIDSLTETNDASLRLGICTLHALFQVHWETAAAIISQDGIVENIMEGTDLSQSAQLYEDIAHLLGQASGHKRCRGTIPSQAVRWLEAKALQTSNSVLRAAAAVALVKYSRGVATDASEATTGVGEIDDAGQEARLTEMMKGLVVSEEKRDSLGDAVEGLAYLSTRPETKETLSLDSTFLRQLFSLIPHKKPSTTSTDRTAESALVYGVLAIISNICAYRPRLSEEQAQLEKLKKVAQATKSNLPTGDHSQLESDEQVRLRVRRLVDAGVLNAIGSALTTGDSVAVRLQIGKAVFNIVEDKENRGKVLQSGGARTLFTLIKHALASLTSKDQILDSAYLEAIQALAKLAITSSPVQVFGPDIGAVFDAIRPFSIMLQHPSSTLLQKFEANMALTNLSSYQPEVAERIAKADGLLSRVDLLMLEDHVLVRRSAVELICNLIAGSDEVFERYGGAPNSPNAKSKLQILVALADVDDLSTALAASGALATLTCSPYACQALAQLQRERNRVLPVLTQLIDPSVVVFPSEDDVSDDRTTHENPGLVHRGIVCVRNLLNGIDDTGTRKSLEKDAESVGLVKALVRLIKGEGLTKEQMILVPAAEALQVMVKDGVKV